MVIEMIRDIEILERMDKMLLEPLFWNISYFDLFLVALISMYLTAIVVDKLDAMKAKAIEEKEGGKDETSKKDKKNNNIV